MSKYLVSVLLALPLSTLGQGTFIYDQQSSTIEGSPPYGSGSTMQSFASPWGQSFTPSLSTMDFIRLLLVDGNINDGLGATMHINLLSGSPSGTIIGATAPLTMGNYFSGTATFVFPSSVPITPGVTYYFEPVLEPGSGAWNTLTQAHTYPGGSFFMGGLPYPGTDLWFREGIIIPEPSAIAFTSLAFSALLITRVRSRKS